MPRFDVGPVRRQPTDRDLRAEFEKFGPLLRCEITLDRETGQSRGFGFVSFTCVEHADAAIAKSPLMSCGEMPSVQGSSATHGGPE